MWNIVFLPIQSLKGFFFSWSMQKEVFFCCKVQYIPALPSPVDTFLAFFLYFLLLKHFSTE